MKAAIGLSLVLFVGIGSAVAQFLWHWSRVNLVGEEHVRAVASRLVIGMPEQAAVSLLATNGLETNAFIQDTNEWTRIYSFTNAGGTSCGLAVVFRQKPGEVPRKGRVVEMTNGILHAALLNRIQIARTNKPLTNIVPGRPSSISER